MRTLANVVQFLGIALVAIAINYFLWVKPLGEAIPQSMTDSANLITEMTAAD